MARIAERAEQPRRTTSNGPTVAGREQRKTPRRPERITQAITHAAWQAAIDSDVDADHLLHPLGPHRSGDGPLPAGCTKMLGLSPIRADGAGHGPRAGGSPPMSVGTYQDTDELVWCVVEATVVLAGHVHEGDVIAVLAGAPDQHDGATDVLRIVRVD